MFSGLQLSVLSFEYFTLFKHFALFTAGLPDMAMSALVKEQIEGIAPTAISMIPPDKLSVS